MKLTSQEEKIIIQLRKEDEERQRRKENALNVLLTAHLFAVWMEAEGMGQSYSTFCSDFRYDAGEGESRRITYDKVIEIIKLAKS